MLSETTTANVAAIAAMSHHHGTYRYLVETDGRPFLAHLPVGHSAVTSGSGSTATGPSVTLTAADGTSILLHAFAGTTTTWDSAPVGYTRQAAVDGVSSGGGCCLNSKRDTTVDGSMSQGTIGGSLWWSGATVEVLAATPPAAGNPGAFFPIIMA